MSSLSEYLETEEPFKKFHYKIDRPRRKCIVITRKDVKVSSLDTMVPRVRILGMEKSQKRGSIKEYLELCTCGHPKTWHVENSVCIGDKNGCKCPEFKDVNKIKSELVLLSNQDMQSVP